MSEEVRGEVRESSEASAAPHGPESGEVFVLLGPETEAKEDRGDVKADKSCSEMPKALHGPK